MYLCKLVFSIYADFLNPYISGPTQLKLILFKSQLQRANLSYRWTFQLMGGQHLSPPHCSSVKCMPWPSGSVGWSTVCTPKRLRVQSGQSVYMGQPTILSSPLLSSSFLFPPSLPSSLPPFLSLSLPLSKKSINTSLDEDF